MLPLSPAQTHSAFCRIPALLKDPKRWARGLEPSRAEIAQGSWQVGPRKARGKSETRDA